MKRQYFTVRIAFLVILMSCMSANWATESFFAQSRTVKLLDSKENVIEIGKVHFSPLENGSFKFELKVDYDIFSDYFLSMKEMKCLEGDELWCHIPYPHKTPTTVIDKDLRWLEHALLFMFKDKKSFGADFWNGIYYKLAWEDKKLKGFAQHVDLNMLASPPDKQEEPPIGEYDIEPVDPEKRWLPLVVIE